MRPAHISRDKYVSMSEAAEMLGKPVDWVKARMKQGAFTTLKHGHWTYLTIESVNKVKEQM